MTTDLQMVQEDWMKSWISWTICVKQNDSIGFYKGANVKNIDLTKNFTKVEIQISDTYKEGFLSHKDSGNEIWNPWIDFPEVAGLWFIIT